MIKNFITKPHKYKYKNWKDLHKVIVDGGINVNKWFEIIGSNNPKHITKYLIWKKHGFCPTKTNLKERRKILKGKIDVYSYYQKQECRSGQTDQKGL